MYFKNPYYLNYIVAPKFNIFLRSMSTKNENGTKCNYNILGIKPGATAQEIKQAYYEKSKQYHPDINKEADADKQFQEVSEAYEILSNEESRQEYDISRGFKKPHQPIPINQRHRERIDPEDYSIYTRNIYRRMKQQQYKKIRDKIKEEEMSFGPSFFDQSIKKKMKEETIFYESLSEEQKRKYEEYCLKENEKNKREQEQPKLDLSANLYETRIFILFALIIFFITINSVVDFAPEQNLTKEPTLKTKSSSNDNSSNK